MILLPQTLSHKVTKSRSARKLTGKKREAQVQHARSDKRLGPRSELTGARHHQGEHWEEGGEQPTDSPVLNDETRNPNAPEAQQSAENGHD